MLRTFNCGVGMLAVVASDDAQPLIAHLHASGEQAALIGRLVARSGDAVTFDGKLAL